MATAPLLKFCELMAQIRPGRARELLNQVHPVGPIESVAWLTTAADIGMEPVDRAKIADQLLDKAKADPAVRELCTAHPNLFTTTAPRVNTALRDTSMGRLLGVVWLRTPAEADQWSSVGAATWRSLTCPWRAYVGSPDIRAPATAPNETAWDRVGAVPDESALRQALRGLVDDPSV